MPCARPPSLFWLQSSASAAISSRFPSLRRCLPLPPGFVGQAGTTKAQQSKGIYCAQFMSAAREAPLGSAQREPTVQWNGWLAAGPRGASYRSPATAALANDANLTRFSLNVKPHCDNVQRYNGIGRSTRECGNSGGCTRECGNSGGWAGARAHRRGSKKATRARRNRTRQCIVPTKGWACQTQVSQRQCRR